MVDLDENEKAVTLKWKFDIFTRGYESFYRGQCLPLKMWYKSCGARKWERSGSQEGIEPGNCEARVM